MPDGHLVDHLPPAACTDMSEEALRPASEQRQLTCYEWSAFNQASVHAPSIEQRQRLNASVDRAA
jgi:hypothetical protein